MAIGRHALALCGGSLLLAWAAGSAAQAEDWQFTKWGMTVAEVAAASGGKATPCGPDGCPIGLAERARLTMPMQTDGIDTVVFFDFDLKTDRLTSVLLRPKDKFDNTRWAVAQRIALRAAYGPGKEQQVVGFPIWTWPWGDGEIQLIEAAKYGMDFTDVMYISKAGLDAAKAASE